MIHIDRCIVYLINITHEILFIDKINVYCMFVVELEWLFQISVQIFQRSMLIFKGSRST